MAARNKPVDSLPDDAADVASSPQSAPRGLAVYAAISRITSVLAGEGIGKTRRNQQQNYQFRGIDDVLNALAGLFADTHVVVLPKYSDRTMVEYQSIEGKRLVNVTLYGSFTIKSLIDGSELHVGPFIGEAMDSADKATNKAMSAAYKYFAIQTFAIPTEGDNDADTVTHAVRPKPNATVAPAPQSVAKTQQSPAPETVAGPETVSAALARLIPKETARKQVEAKLLVAYNVVMLDQIPPELTKEAILKVEAFLKASAAKRAKPPAVAAAAEQPAT